MPSIANTLTPELCVRGRLVLYVGMFCPFATRVTIARSLKGLEDLIPIVRVNSVMDPVRKSWTFQRYALPEQQDIGIPGDVPEPLFGAADLRQLYEKSEGKENMEGPFVVPTLWDVKEKRIVSNESASMLRQFSTCFNHLLDGESKEGKVDLYPESLRGSIDEWYEFCQRDVYTGVYKAGFATKQSDYESAIEALYKGLDRLESLCASTKGPYLLGEQLTELDVTTYTCLIRFDVAYATIFKCNVKTIRQDYPSLHRWLRNLYWNHPAFRDSTEFDNIKSNYFAGSSKALQTNPTRIIPLGPLPPILPL
ncbi:hypothetical protein CBS101457_005442 [Exobasidium rhododendri]|nr:hypothetical protein CBS101457_005442 [Exobasidium rhododendri]